jgi:hypothetical protein
MSPANALKRHLDHFASEHPFGQEVLDLLDRAEAQPVWADLGAGSASEYGLTWRTVPAPPARQALENASIYWAEGGPVNSGGTRKRHHLKVRRVSGEVRALRIARQLIDDAGGDSSYLEIVRPSPGAADRIKRMTEILAASHLT